MAGLAIEYSKEVARELTKFAVYLPGEPVSVGDIISFPFGRTGLWKRLHPWGSFRVVANLEDLKVSFQVSQPKADPQPYIFASKKGATVGFTADASTPTGPTSGNGSLNVKFSRQNAVYFAAVDCSTKHVSDLSAISVDLKKHSRDVLWNDTFLVAGVTVASRALVMQSGTSSGALEAKGDVKGLVPGVGGHPNAKASVSITNFSQASFVKPWSDNVTIFFDLLRFEKTKFGAGLLYTKENLRYRGEDEFELVSVSPLDYLHDEDFMDIVTAPEPAKGQGEGFDGDIVGAPEVDGQVVRALE